MTHPKVPSPSFPTKVYSLIFEQPGNRGCPSGCRSNDLAMLAQPVASIGLNEFVTADLNVSVSISRHVALRARFAGRLRRRRSPSLGARCAGSFRSMSRAVLQVWYQNVARDIEGRQIRSKAVLNKVRCRCVGTKSISEKRSTRKLGKKHLSHCSMVRPESPRY